MNDSLRDLDTAVPAPEPPLAPPSSIGRQATLPPSGAIGPKPPKPWVSGTYWRKVSALERYSLVLNEAYRYHVDGIVEGLGRIDPLALQLAVDRAARANPAIRVRLRGFLIWTRWVDSGIAPQVRLLPLSEWNGISELNAPFLQQKLQPMRGGPIADVLIVPCTDGKTRLVLRTLHAAIDGRGFLHWLAEVTRAMRGEPLEGSHSRLTDHDIQDQYADQVPAEAPQPPSLCIPVLAPSAGGRAPLAYIWRRAIIDNHVSQLLPKTALFLAQWARKREPGPVGFTIPVDYRGLRTREMGIGNLTGYVRLTVDEDATPRLLMQQITQKLRTYADCRRIPGIKSLFWAPVWWIHHKIKPSIDTALYTISPAFPSGGLVSMGTIKNENYSFPGFDAQVTYGIPGAVGKLNTVFVNTPTSVVVTFSAPAAYNVEGQLDELVAAYRQHFSKTSSKAGISA